MYFLLKQSQWVSNEQVGNMLCQKVVNTYKMKIQTNNLHIAKAALGKQFLLQDLKHRTLQCYLNPPHPVRSLNDEFRKEGND